MKNQKLNLKLIVVFLIFSGCHQTKLVELKDDTGNIIEKYRITKDSVKIGDYYSYFPGGTVREKAYYENGQLNGERVLYFPSGDIEIQESYNMDIMNGAYKVFYENGNLLQELVYNEGKIQGMLKGYYENGGIKEEVTIVDNEENGPFTEYYENGKIHWEGSYLNGDNEFGLLKEYNIDGVLIKKMNCDSLAICRTIWTLEKGDHVPEN